jgi:hypothetical protein
MRLALAIAVTLCSLIPASARAQDDTTVDVSRALDGAAWIGPGVSMGDLRGKSVVLLTYVTWCPKCNVWAPQLFADIKAAAADRPIVIIAVCTDAPTVPGPVYCAEKGMVGINILHAYDAQMDARLALDDAALFNSALIGPDGEVVWKGQAGTYFTNSDGSRDYAIARKVREFSNPGEFTIIIDEMPSDVQQLLWPMELGRLIPDRDLNRVKRKLSPESRTALDEAVDGFVARQLEIINELKEGEVPQQMAAYAKADLLAKTYPTTEEGRTARSIVSEFNRDSAFKKEIVARTAYEKLLENSADQSQARQAGQLTGFINRFEGTWAAEQAAALLANEDSERDSSGAEPVAAP